jgi:glycosyltransferase involved in cell wall biosynthesis
MDDGDVEVIVVPNGPDDSWRQTLRPYLDKHYVRAVPIRDANANIARNAGLAEAGGEFIRFLDDDDYLFPESAARQYELISTTGADVVSGSVQLVDEKGRYLEVWRQPDTDDLCAAVLGPFRNCLPTAHVYRRSCLESINWNPATKVRQDIEWLLDLCASLELKWEKTKDVVGIWQQHPDQRVSSRIHINEICRITVPMLIRTYKTLQANNRLTEPRRKATAVALWGLTAKAFLFDPLYWSNVARTAMKIDPVARHPYVEYHFPVICRLNPLLIQWLLLPKRWALYHVRKLIGMCHRA